jgi:hypothetical protein
MFSLKHKLKENIFGLVDSWFLTVSSHRKDREREREILSQRR